MSDYPAEKFLGGLKPARTYNATEEIARLRISPQQWSKNFAPYLAISHVGKERFVAGSEIERFLRDQASKSPSSPKARKPIQSFRTEPAYTP